MRILFVSHSLPPADGTLENVGGMQRSAVELYEALRAHPDVLVVPCVLRSAWKARHWRVPRFLASALVRIAHLAARREVDVVLFSSIVTGALVVLLRRRLERAGVRSAIIVHGLDVTLPVAPHQLLVRRIFRTTDLVLPVSHATAAECIARGLSPDRAVVVPPGLDARRFAAPEDHADARPSPELEDAVRARSIDGAGDRAHARQALVAALGDRVRPLPDGALLLCSVGRQVERKGFHWFVAEVMPRVASDVHWWLAGDGPEHERIRGEIARRGLGARVRLLGAVTEEQLAMLYRGADLFVMPNVAVAGDMEGFGLVVLEAGACGLPVVASRREGITDAVTEGENGHLVSSSDPEAFAAAVERYRRDRGALAALGARARRHVVANFDWPVAVERYIAALVSTASAPGVAASGRGRRATTE